MEASIIGYGHDKKREKGEKRSCASSHVPSYLLPEQFYQPGDCEKAGWPDVTHIVASAFEGFGTPLSPEMGWLNRFCVFTCARPPGAHNLSDNKKVDRRTDSEFRPKQWMNFLSNDWIELQVAQYLFMALYSWGPVRNLNCATTVGYLCVRGTWSCVGRRLNRIMAVLLLFLSSETSCFWFKKWAGCSRDSRDFACIFLLPHGGCRRARHCPAV